MNLVGATVSKPAIITVKSSTIYQWIKEFKEWTTLDGMGICPLISSKSYVIPGFKAYIVSHDLLANFTDKFIAIKPAIVIADEVQQFKNPRSARSKALVKLIQDGKVEHKIFLSGTPYQESRSQNISRS